MTQPAATRAASEQFKVSVIGFYGIHENQYGCFSNWYSSPFTFRGIKFDSGEQFMMYQKAVTFNDARIAQQILATNSPAEIKRLGRKVSGFDEQIWEGRRQIIVYSGLLEKFRQNSHLKQLLLSTGNSIIAECSPTDTVWGIGLALSDSRINDMKQWKGRNLLGFILMEVRSTLSLEA